MIHWQYTKGAYNERAPNTGTGDNTILYTFIDYYGGRTLPENEDDINEDYLPHIYISNNTNRNDNNATGYDFGHIVTNGVDQTFEKWVDIWEGLGVVRITTIDGDEWLWAKTQNWTIYIGRETFNTIDFLNGAISFNSTVPAFNTSMTISHYLKVGNPSSGNKADGTIVGKNIYSDGLCQAQYFNSTSDRRAKTDIKPINKSVLPLVTNTQLYSFKYKDLDTPSIGIIAQDVQDVDFDGFSLVDNKEATGQDMDYMSIHESKLVYVLWKAIQEQQKEIEDLKEQIKKGL